MSKSYQINIQTDIIFGQGSCEKLPEKIRQYDVSKVMVVTDEYLVKTDSFNYIQGFLDNGGIDYYVYSEVEPDPTIEIVEKGAHILKEQKCEIVLGFGGGSSIDAAKAIAIMATNEGSIKNYFGKDKVKTPAIPIISIPTTAGTGSEVTMLASIKDISTQSKCGINDPHILPSVAIIDPQFLTTLPQKIAAETGMDTLAHLIESYVSKGSNPMTDLLTLEGIRIFGEYFLPFVAERNNITAAEKMGLASMLGGIGISHARTGGAHTLTRPVVVPGVSHGLSTGLVLPYVMDFNIISNPAKFARVAEALGERLEGNVLIDAKKSVTAVFNIMQHLDYPMKLSEIGVKEENLPEMAKKARKLDVSQLNPRELTEEAILSIYRKAI